MPWECLPKGWACGGMWWIPNLCWARLRRL
jgi:hypothetical protein